ncbi:MAG: lysylphosphatidylglycerol synthase transmembrane domain-containing protein [Terriglobia bacterium]
MGISRKSWLRSILTFAAGFGLVALLCRKLEFSSIIQLLEHTSLPLLALSVAALFTFYILRALRWAIILQWKVSFGPLFAYSSIGYLVSSIAPAQAGELVKPALVQARHGLPYFATAASVAVERLLDVATLVLLGVAAMFALPSHALGPVWIVASLKAGGVVCACALLILGLSSRWADSVLRIVSRTLSLLRLPPHLNERITNMVRMFLQGTGGALSPFTLLYALLCSMVVWGANAVSVAMIYGAVNGRVPSLPVVTLGFAVFSLGLAIPLTPAYVGQYEGLWLLVFTSLHVASKSDVLAVGLLCHSLILLTIVFFGLLSLGLLRLSDGSGRSSRDNPRVHP